MPLLCLIFYKFVGIKNSMDKKVLIIIPAFNEESTIATVLSDLKLQCPAFDVLVVNDASCDKTAEIARSVEKVRVVDLPVNLGIGGAVQTGLKFANRNGYDCAIQFDADGQHKAADVGKLVRILLRGKYDVVIGSRFVGNNRMHETDYMRRMGILIFEYFSLILIRKRIKDHTSGFRAFNKKAVDFIVHEYPVDYPEPEIVVLLARNRFKIKEVFTQMYSRQGGVSSISLMRGPYYMVKVMLSMFMAIVRSKQLDKS
jgi:glycosyltransferase involved in cell wall biosynthesis